MLPRAVVTCALLVSACKNHTEPARDAATRGELPALAIVATCADASGAVDARRKGEPKWEPVRIGATFRERDWVRTGDDGYTRLRFSDRRFLELPERTTILIDNEITIDSGSLVAVAGGGESMRIKAADGSVAQIISTSGDARSELRFTPSKTKGVEIAVTKGTVRLVTSAGEQALGAGEASDLANDRAGAVAKLPGAPAGLSLDTRLQLAPGVLVPLRWAPVAGATRYRVQVALDPTFRVREIDRELPGPEMSFTPDRAGTYVWRVASIDGQGRLGAFGDVRQVQVDTEPIPDLLLAPAPGAKIGYADKTPVVSFTWRAAGSGLRYRLVVVLGTDLGAEPVATETTTGQRLEVRTLREGTYHWGVYAVTDTRETPIFSSPRALTIRKQRVKVHTEKLWQSPR